MLDPLTIFSTAGTALQFVEEGVKLVSKAYDYYKSADGVGKEHRDLTRIALILNSISANLESTWSSNTGRATNAETAVRQANSECLKISQDFLQLLDKLQLHNTRSAWKAAGAAVRSLWNRDRVESFEKRLSHARANLNISILVYMQSLNNDARHQFKDTVIGLRRDVLDAMQDVQYDLKHDLSKLTDSLQGLQINDERIMEKLDGFHSLKQQELGHLFYRTQMALEGEWRERTSSTARMLKNSLRSVQLEERQASIDTAAEDTFGWIFQPKNSHLAMAHYFPAWLSFNGQSTNIFWVSGKAASGKSTLMKYLSQKLSNATFYLERWQNGRPLIQAHSFFWSAGSKIQKSMHGLLRSLLYQLLCHMFKVLPDLVRPQRWADAYTEGQASIDWTNEELRELLGVLIDRTRDTHCIFILIDGLDEFEGSDEEVQGMIDTLGELSRSENVKICASSRPWNIFVDAFEGCLQLKMEDFTHDDIYTFVVDRFRENRYFLDMIKHEHLEPQDLINQIVGRSDGVFLWVKLVTNQLLAGMRDGDTVKTLMDRLTQIPVDLETLFERMFESVQPAYRSESAVVFQIMLHARECAVGMKPTLMHLSYLDVGKPNFALDYNSDPLHKGSRDELRYCLHRTARRLNSRSMGLLTTPFCLSTTCNPAWCDVPLSGHSLRVDFLHRTVSDFFASNRYQRELHRLSNGPWATRSFCCNAMIMDLDPQMNDTNPEKNEGNFMKKVEELAKHTTEESGGLVVFSAPLQQKVEQILQRTAGKGSYSYCDGVSAEIFTSWARYKNNLLTTAIQYGQHEYVLQNLTKRMLQARVGRPLLDYALWRQLTSDEDPQPSISVVRHILELGADPNETFEGRSIWLTFLCLTYRKLEHASKRELEFVRATMELMIDHGADMHSMLIRSCWRSINKKCSLSHDRFMVEFVESMKECAG